MATKKKAANVKKAVQKPAKKSVSNKKANTPLKKTASKKVAVKPKASTKSPAKKTVAKKTPPAKKTPQKQAGMKSVSGKTSAAKQPMAKPVTKAVAKAEQKVVSKPEAKPVTKAVAKAEAKVVTKPEAKPVAKTPAKPMQPLKPTIQPAASKVNTSKTMITTQKNNNGSEKSRYSDSELKEFKELIIRKLDDARTELINLNAAIISANENGTDDTGASFKMLEDGSDTLAKEEAAQLAARQKKFIEQLEAALVRIENKTYGVCRVTGKLIPKERLRAVPHTTQSMEAKLQQYKD